MIDFIDILAQLLRQVMTIIDHKHKTKNRCHVSLVILVLWTNANHKANIYELYVISRYCKSCSIKHNNLVDIGKNLAKKKICV